MTYGIFHPYRPDPIEEHDSFRAAERRARELRASGELTGPVQVRPSEAGAPPSLWRWRRIRDAVLGAVGFLAVMMLVSC